MADIATISLRVNTSELERGNQALDNFQQSAKKSAKAADSFGDSNKSASAKTDDLAESVNETHRRMREYADRLRSTESVASALGAKQDKLAESYFRQIDAIKNVAGASAKLKAIQAELGKANRAGELGQGNYIALLGETTDKLRQAEKAEARLSTVRVEFIRRLKEQVAAQTLSREELLRYKAAQLGVGSSADIYIKKLSESSKALSTLKLNSAATRRELGVMIAQLARGDISGLKSSALTTASRSGLLGQLMTMRGLAIGGVFGGIAVGLAAVTKAYFEGAKEAQEYNKQLVLTGHYAGQTVGELQSMARVLSGNGLTQAKMAAAISQVVGTGSFSGGDVSVIAGVAVRMESAVGQSIDETVKHFERLKDEPVKAAQELDKSLHFLTATQLENILSLENQGRASEAAKAAMDAYASAMNKRAGEIVNGLGWLEKAWKAVGDTASSAWDKMLNIGREQTTKEKIASIEQTLLDFQLNPAKQGVYSYETGLTPDDLKKELAELKEQDFLESIKSARDKDDREENERQKQRTQQNQELKRLTESAEEKHQRKLSEIRSKYDRADKALVDKYIAAENKRYGEEVEREKKRGNGGAKSYSDDAATKMLLESKQRLASIQEQVGASSQLTEQEKRLAEFTQQIAELKEKRILTADQKSILTRSDEIKASLELESSESRRLKNAQELAKGHETALKFIEQQQAAISAIQGSAGLSNRQVQRNREIEQTKMMKASPEDRDSALEKLKERYAVEDELRGDWLLGAKQGWNEYLDSATNTYAAMSSVAQSALGGMSNMLTNLVTTGTASFKQFTVSILKMIVDIINRMMVAYAIQRAMGWVNATFNPQGGGEGSASFVGPIQQKWSGGYTGDGGKYEPKGVVHGGEFVFTKEATRAIGVGNLYAMMRGTQGYADGGYVGKAPMYGSASGSARTSAPQVYITLNQDGSTDTSSSSGWESFGKEIGAFVDQRYHQNLAKDLGQSGRITKAISGRAGR